MDKGQELMHDLKFEIELKMSKAKILNNKYLYTVGIISIYSSFNNTLITVKNIKDKTILCGSSGFVGLKGAKRSTSYAGQSIAQILGEKIFNLGFRFIYIEFKGFGNARKAIIKSFLSSNLIIIGIKDTSHIAHNGCKSKKRRRI